jgi:hypothetical protein
VSSSAGVLQVVDNLSLFVVIYTAGQGFLFCNKVIIIIIIIILKILLHVIWDCNVSVSKYEECGRGVGAFVFV